MSKSKKVAVLSRSWRLSSLIILLALALSFAWPQPARAGWVQTNDLKYARYAHTATILANGQVLVAGGTGDNGTLFGGPIKYTELYDPATGAWSLSGSLNTAHCNHTATLLPNGQVLVAGGDSAGTVELYDPGLGTWSTLPPLKKARSEHTATLLSDGTVLLAGGKDNTASPPSVLQDAEIYNPATGISQLVATPMNSPRIDHTATLLPNGQVLVAGGKDAGSQVLQTAELFDPASGTWNPTPLMLSPHASHTATLLPSGQVLVAGGDDGGNQSNGIDENTTELYDSVGNTWSSAGLLKQGRQGHTATLLPDGRVLVVGGWTTFDWLGINTTEFYDPNTSTWSYGDNLQQRRYWHTATLLASGKILLAGGLSSAQLLTTEFYYPATGQWTATDPGGTLQPRYYHTATLLPNGQVLVAGGDTGAYHPLNTAQIYDPASETWKATAAFTAREVHTATLLPAGLVLVAGGYDYDQTVPALSGAQLYDLTKGAWRPTRPLSQARFGHTATLLANGQVLVVGGCNDYRTELYDPVSGTWSYTAPMSALRYYHTATLLPNGWVLVTGGYSYYGVVASAELYDPDRGSWIAAGSLSTGRKFATATLLPNGKVLVAGGQDGNNNTLNTAELYDPASGTWSPTGDLNTPRCYHTATLLPNGQVLVTGGWDGTNPSVADAELYDPASGTWIPTAVMNVARHGHTATLLPYGQVLVAAGVNSSGILASSELYDVGLGFNAAWRPQIISVQLISGPGGSWPRPYTADPGVAFGITLANICQGFMQAQRLSQGCQVQLFAVEDKQTIHPLIDALQSSGNFIVTQLQHGVANDLYQVTITIGGIPSLSCLIRVGPAVIPPYLANLSFMDLLLN